MDLFGHYITKNIGGNFYALVLVYDFSRYTSIFFLASMNEALKPLLC